MKEETCAICPLRSSWYDHLVMQWNIRWSQTQGTLSILLGTPKAPQEHTRTEIWRAPEPRSCGVALIRIRPLFSRYRCEFGKTFLFSHTSSPKRLLSIQSQSKSIMGANYSYLVSTIVLCLVQKERRYQSCPSRKNLWLQLDLLNLTFSVFLCVVMSFLVVVTFIRMKAFAAEMHDELLVCTINRRATIISWNDPRGMPKWSRHLPWLPNFHLLWLIVMTMWLHPFRVMISSCAVLVGMQPKSMLKCGNRCQHLKSWTNRTMSLLPPRLLPCQKVARHFDQNRVRACFFIWKGFWRATEREQILVLARLIFWMPHTVFFFR